MEKKKEKIKESDVREYCIKIKLRNLGIGYGVMYVYSVVGLLVMIMDYFLHNGSIRLIYIFSIILSSVLILWVVTIVHIKKFKFDMSSSYGIEEFKRVYDDYKNSLELIKNNKQKEKRINEVYNNLK